MPAKSDAQRKLMAIAEHDPSKLHKENKGVLKMSHSQLHDFASTKGLKSHSETKDKPGRSIVDTEFIKGNEGDVTHLEGYGYLAKPGSEGHSDISDLGANREPHDMKGKGIEVTWRGPDTEYRVEEINPQHYGRDYEPTPYKDMFKTNYKSRELNIRQEADLCYQDCETPGSVSGEFESSLAYGTVGYKKVPVEIKDHRTYKSQQEYHRMQPEFDERSEDDDDHRHSHR